MRDIKEQSKAKIDEAAKAAKKTAAKVLDKTKDAAGKAGATLTKAGEKLRP